MSVYKRDAVLIPETGSEDSKKFDVYDASMMHIYRKYLPDFTYLYMTKEIFITEQTDHRYTKSMAKLAESNGKTFVEGQDYGIIQSKVDRVFDMDVFYDEYLGILTAIRNMHGEDSQIIVNISSGTPAMKTSLFVLRSMRNLNIELVQATDPEPSKKPVPIKDFVVDDFWTLNRDRILTEDPNGTKKEFRLHVATNRNLNAMKINGIMKELIDAYEYDAARKIYETFFAEEGDFVSTERSKLLDFLTFAENRVMLRIANLKDNKTHKYEEFKTSYVPCYPDKRVYITMEYANRLKLYFDCKDYTGAARALTPLDTKLLSKVLEEKIGIDPFTCTDDKAHLKPVDSLPEPLKNIYIEAYPKCKTNNNKTDLLSVGSLFKMIKVAYKNERKSEVYQAVAKIADIETRVRNVVAHTLASYSENKFLVDAQLKDVDELLNLYSTIWSAAGFGDASLEWNLYDKMNVDIKKLIDEVL